MGIVFPSLVPRRGNREYYLLPTPCRQVKGRPDRLIQIDQNIRVVFEEVPRLLPKQLRRRWVSAQAKDPGAGLSQA